MTALVHTSPKISPLQPVLVVDDNPENLALLREFLEDYAFTVHTASNASTAAAFINTSLHTGEKYQFVMLASLFDTEKKREDRGNYIAERILLMPAYRRLAVYGASAEESSWPTARNYETFQFLRMKMDDTGRWRWDLSHFSRHLNKLAA